MNEYETEEQQLDALKKWWKENATSLIVGVCLGISGLFGWRYYLDQSHFHSVQASDLYMQGLISVQLNGVDDGVMDINNTLINDFSDTPYAALSSLALAKLEYEKGDVDAATAQLELAVKHANNEELKQIAILRLASVYIDQKKYEEVVTLLDMPHESAFEARYEELKGDLYVAKGDTDQARVAYDNAITLLGVSAGKWLMLKRQNLGSAQNDASAIKDLKSQV